MTTKWIFDLQDRDVYWCTADVGWITGHSYIVYGPLSNGATSLMYEGVPRLANPGCFWDVVEKIQSQYFLYCPHCHSRLYETGRRTAQSQRFILSAIVGNRGRTH